MTPGQRASRMLAGVVVIAAVLAVFLLEGKASIANSHFTTRMSTRIAARAPLPPGLIALSVQAPSRLRAPLETRLGQQLSSMQAGSRIGTAPVPSDRPALSVHVTGPIHWTPFHSTADVTARFVIRTSRPGEPIALEGEVGVTDSTTGLVTRPGYYDQLAQQLSALLALQLESALEQPIRSPAPGK